MLNCGWRLHHNTHSITVDISIYMSHHWSPLPSRKHDRWVRGAPSVPSHFRLRTFYIRRLPNHESRKFTVGTNNACTTMKTQTIHLRILTIILLCGLGGSTRDARELIVNGSDADPTKYPFFVFSRFGQRRGCGGTLIHSDIVLTAAHCYLAFVGRGMLVGPYTLEGTGVFFEDEAQITHPEYDSSIEKNDIMLIKLVGFSDAPVVELNFEPAIPADDETVTVIGLGRTSPGGSLAETLQEANVPVIDHQTCSDYWGQFVSITEDIQLCAGTNEQGSDACQGDSGGPLFDSMLRQVGIISFGDSCGVDGAPAVYTRVSGYKDFIQNGICELSDDPPAYCSPTPSPTISTRPSSAPTRTSPTIMPLVPTLSPTAPTSKPHYTSPPFHKGVRYSMKKTKQSSGKGGSMTHKKVMKTVKQYAYSQESPNIFAMKTKKSKSSSLSSVGYEDYEMSSANPSHSKSSSAKSPKQGTKSDGMKSDKSSFTKASKQKMYTT